MKLPEGEFLNITFMDASRLFLSYRLSLIVSRYTMYHCIHSTTISTPPNIGRLLGNRSCCFLLQHIKIPDRRNHPAIYEGLDVTNIMHTHSHSFSRTHAHTHTHARTHARTHTRTHAHTHTESEVSTDQPRTGTA